MRVSVPGVAQLLHSGLASSLNIIPYPSALQSMSLIPCLFLYSMFRWSASV